MGKNIIKFLAWIFQFKVRKNGTSSIHLDNEFSAFLVKNAHKIPPSKDTIIKYKNKFYRIRELG